MVIFHCYVSSPEGINYPRKKKAQLILKNFVSEGTAVVAGGHLWLGEFRRLPLAPRRRRCTVAALALSRRNESLLAPK